MTDADLINRIEKLIEIFRDASLEAKAWGRPQPAADEALDQVTAEIRKHKAGSPYVVVGV